ncbi:MAG: aspartate kinase [Flavobacteriaceae bacterium]|nr:aspartate kinase [Flavobacteriaceae bacterium]|tara:strand:+ start:19661 stop:20914 length:1254 start_codon:yes stop_codon:yes gene_type:complete
MKVFKFGGASVKDSKSIKNIIEILKLSGYDDVIIVISAIGKTTNALEFLVKNYMEGNSSYSIILKKIKDDHLEIINDLFKGTEKSPYNEVVHLTNELNSFLKINKSTDHSFIYDQVVCFGELISTKIISFYLELEGIKNYWLDVRKCLKTDSYYRNAALNWNETEKLVKKETKNKNTIITQGFIASDSKGYTTTLGREGSDYTAAIFAFILNSSSLTIWKDVPGVLNADPRYFKTTQLLKNISYREAIELAYYGASVIHPKTLQPLQQKKIPLFVKSFENPKGSGTKVFEGSKLNPLVPCFILKKNQILLELSTLDFSFIVEENISQIFSLMDKYKMRVEMIQNSAISFAVCINDRYENLKDLVSELNLKFKVEVKENVSLYTIRHFNNPSIKEIKGSGKRILLEQRTYKTAQFILI